VLNRKFNIFEKVIDSIDTAIISNDLLGNVICWNKATEKILGYTFEEMSLKTIFAIYPPNLFEEEAKFILEIKANHLIENYETKRIHKDGNIIDISINVTPLKDEKGNIIGLSKVIQNISKSNQVINKLVESEETYKNLFENSPLPIWVLDIPSLKFLAVNKKSIKDYGYSKEEFLNMTVYDMCPEYEQNRIQNIDRSVLNYQLPTNSWLHLKKNGKLVPVEVTSLEILYEGKRARLVISINMTDAKENKLALEESHNRLKRLTEKIPIVLMQIEFLTDDKFEIPFVSKSISNIYNGFNAENIQKNPGLINDWVIDEDKIRVLKEYKSALKNLTDLNLECGINNSDGSISWIKAFYRPEKSETGHITWYGYIEDISTQKKLLLNLKKQNQKLKDIAWTQSHIVRAPLTTLMGLVNRLKKRDISIEEQQIFLEHIQKTADELDNVIKNITQLSSN